jgi:hypothetical protein
LGRRHRPRSQADKEQYRPVTVSRPVKQQAAALPATISGAAAAASPVAPAIETQRSLSLPTAPRAAPTKHAGDAAEVANRPAEPDKELGATAQSSSRMAGWRCCMKPMMALSMTFASLVAT